MDERICAGSGFLGSFMLTLLVYGHFISFNVDDGRVETIRQKQVGSVKQPRISRGHKAIRILCWIPTQPQNYLTKTVAVKETWVRDCDITLFFSSTNNSDIPTINLGIPERRKLLIKKTFAALQYIYTHYLHKADWFMKADDDTYVIVNNLRHFLSDKDPDAKVYYGSTFNMSRYLYQSGGAGYVMGPRVLRLIAERNTSLEACADNGPEDTRIGKCLKSLGVSAEISVDKLGNTLFHWAYVGTALGLDNSPAWAIWRQPLRIVNSSISKEAISFHAVLPYQMRIFHFILHNLTIYGDRKPKIP